MAKAQSQDFLRGGGGAIRNKWTSAVCGGGVMGAPRTPFFNKKVDLSCLRGGARAPLAPPLPTGLLHNCLHTQLSCQVA